MTFRKRLVLGMGSLVALLVLTGVISALHLRATADRMDRVAVDIGEELAMVERLRYRAERLVAANRAHLLTGNPLYEEKRRAVRRDFELGLDGLDARLGSGADGYLARIRESGKAYSAAAERAPLPVGRSSHSSALTRFFEDEMRPARHELDLHLDELVDHQRAAFREELRRSRASADRAGLAIGLSTSLGLLVGASLAVAVARQLAEQFRREQEASQEAKRAVAAKEEILAIIAHDLRSPLTAILMTTALLGRKAPASAEVLCARVSTVQRAAERMRHMIEELLEVARIDARTMELHKEECDAGQMLRGVVQIFELEAQQKNVRLVEEAPVPPVVVSADRERLARVISNLVGNALKFTPDGGEVMLRVEQVEGCIRFTVRDDGPGIPPDQVPRLFERHWQARRSGAEGLGLGLYIAKSLVEAHGGEIRVETAPGRGATFVFTVPAKEA